MTKDEALRLALEALESTGENNGYHGVTQYFDETMVDKAITAIKAALEAKDEPDDNELRRLRDLLGKANALARIRANEIESLKASLYGLYELEKHRDELEQRLAKTEGQLGEAVWNYGELKREQLANQQKTSGSPMHQKPVAWMYDWTTSEGEFIQNWTTSEAELLRDTEPNIISNVRPLYTTPPQRKPLTDDEIAAIVREASRGSAIRRDGSTSLRIARAIEAAHGIKGEA